MGELENKISEIISSDNEIIYYDSELIKECGNLIYRVYILKKSGSVAISDCVKINDLLSPLLDIYEPTKSKYFFEVSSPGIERKLKTIDNYKKSIGTTIKVIFNDGNKLKGLLKDVKNDIIEIENEKIKFDDIKKGKTLLVME